MAQQILSDDQKQWITQQFNGTTYQPNAMDVQHEPLYDTITFAAAATINNLTQFFTSPSGKTLAQTNVTTAKRLDAPEAFAVMGIRFRVQEDILLSDFIALMGGVNGYVLEFWIGQKEYNRGPLWFYNAGGGVAGLSTVAAASALTNGRPARPDSGALGVNIVIDNQASFFGQLVSCPTPLALTAANSGGTGATVQMLLDGLHARGVQ